MLVPRHPPSSLRRNQEREDPVGLLVELEIAYHGHAQPLYMRIQRTLVRLGNEQHACVVVAGDLSPQRIKHRAQHPAPALSAVDAYRPVDERALRIEPTPEEVQPRQLLEHGGEQRKRSIERESRSTQVADDARTIRGDDDSDVCCNGQELRAAEAGGQKAFRALGRIETAK